MRCRNRHSRSGPPVDECRRADRAAPECSLSDGHSQRCGTSRLAAFWEVLDAALRFLREAQLSNITHALREIYLAARSDAELRARIEPTVASYYAEVVAASSKPGAC